MMTVLMHIKQQTHHRLHNYNDVEQTQKYNTLNNTEMQEQQEDSYETECEQGNIKQEKADEHIPDVPTEPYMAVI